MNALDRRDDLLEALREDDFVAFDTAARTIAPSSRLVPIWCVRGRGGADRPMAFLSAYDPHEYTEERVRALVTARDEPLAEILAAVRQNLVGPTLQHLIVSAPRGLGKSFLMRLVQLEIERISRDEGLPLAVVLTPEEMPHVKEPETLPRELARVLRGESGAAAELTWHEDDGEAWEEAVEDLAKAVREKLGEKGLLVAIVENFDVLLRRAFGKEVQASRLREWLAAPNGRLMLLAASASGAFDRKYDDRLFQAFREVPLEPWTVDECMAFFDRQRGAAGKPPLGEEARARARAVASFIGGAPRLAALLGDALFDDDVLRAADLLDRVQHELTPYYKDRIEALPGRSQKLLDALLRFGEPATQTELAVRVKARSQTAIAEPFKDLVRERVVVGAKAEGSAEVRYRVADRVFAHYYRRRIVDHGKEHCPLEAMVDLLADFYSPQQKAAKAGEFARAGRIAEARVMARLHDAETGERKRGRGSILLVLAAYYLPKRCAPLASDAIGDALREIAELARSREVPGAYRLIEDAFAAAAEPADRAVLLLARSRLDAYEGVEGGLPAVEAARAALKGERRCPVGLEVEIARAWSLRLLSRHEEALAVAHHAAELAETVRDIRQQAIATRHAADSLDCLGRRGEAVATARRAAELAERAGDVEEQSVATRLAAFSLGKLGRHDEAVAAARRAGELAQQAGDSAEAAYASLDLARIFVDAARWRDALAPLAKASALYSAQAGWERAYFEAVLRATATAAASQLSAQAASDGLTALLAGAGDFDASKELRATFRRWMREFVNAALRELSDPDRPRLWGEAIALRFGDRFEDLVGWLRAAADYHESGRRRSVLAKLDPDFAHTLELMYPPADEAQAEGARRGRGARAARKRA